MKFLSLVLALVCCGSLSGQTGTAKKTDLEKLRQQVIATERGFAATLAARDFEAFGGFVSPEAVFFAEKGVLRGKADVIASWKGFFDGPLAPFSWSPDEVEVLDSGTLALSSGPVFDPKGKLIARFNSIWRLDSDGKWRIVFDKGSPVVSDKAE